MHLDDTLLRRIELYDCPWGKERAVAWGGAGPGLGGGEGGERPPKRQAIGLDEGLGSSSSSGSVLGLSLVASQEDGTDGPMRKAKVGL